MSSQRSATKHLSMKTLFSFGGSREEQKAGGINYKEIFNRDFKIKVLVVFIHFPILLKPTNLNTGKQ